MKITKAKINTLNFIISESIRISEALKISTINKNFHDFYEKEYGSGAGGLSMFINPPRNHPNTLDIQKIIQIKLSKKSQSSIIFMLTGIIKEEQLEMYVTVDEVYIEFKKSFYNHIVYEEGKLDSEGCLKILKDTLHNVKSILGNENFYFPILAQGLGDNEINFGISSIIPRDKIFLELNEEFDELSLKMANEFCESPQYSYDHLLKITIKNCSRERRITLSKQIANLVVGIVQLFSEHYRINSNLLALSLNPYPNYNNFYITKTDKEYNYNFSSIGRVAFSDEFWVKFKEDISYDIGDIINQIIIHATSPNTKPVLADRLIDSIFIFRSAMQDNDEASRIVKLTTSLERLVSTQKDNISSTFRKRVFLLISRHYTNDKNWMKIAKEMYQYRSSIVHGSWSLYRQLEPLYVNKYSEITSKAILSACICFFEIGLKREDDTHLLDSFYDYLIQNEAP